MRCIYKYLVISILVALVGCIESDAASKVRKSKVAGKAVSDSTSMLVAYTDTLTDEYLDTVNVKKKFLINDYSLFGVTYGMGMSQTMFNPTKKQGMLSVPMIIGINYTKYCKMFGYMPYFGLEIGALYTQNGYKFKKNKEGEYTEAVDGAIKAVYDVLEANAMANFHIDVWHLKFLADFGLYGGYRLKVHREGLVGYGFDKNYEDKFYDYDKRWDYGFKGGAGFGLFFDPIEIHFMARYKYGLGSLYRPDYHSQYYYRFAGASDFQFTVGVYLQLSKRTGRTKPQLRKEAKAIVFPQENTMAPAQNK